MAKTTVLSESRYAKLVKDIRRLIEEGRERATKAAQTELVRTYWEIGRRISEEMLTDNAGYAQAVLEDLSEELNIDLSTLKRSLYFFQTYKSATSSTKLTWSHYKYLLSISNDRERAWYEQLTEDENLNVLQLSHAIKEGRYERQKKRKAAQARLKRPGAPTYVYKAYVQKVIDGDTLLLRIDLGFQVLKEQRVRLAGIDAPAMDEPGGREAYRFVRDQLARAEFVMVKTNKIDVYGRYVGHVFYSLQEADKVKIFEKGNFLNQQLIDRGLARVV